MSKKTTETVEEVKTNNVVESVNTDVKAKRLLRHCVFSLENIYNKQNIIVQWQQKLKVH